MQLDRSIKYFRHGIYHRKNNPACLWNDGYLVWHQYGSPHRKDRPAIIRNNREVQYWVRGKYVEK